MKFNLKTIYKYTNINIDIDSLVKKLTKVGFESYLDDEYINISIPYNRPDCLNYFGIIKEINAITSVKVKKIIFDTVSKIKNEVKIKILDYNFCPKYSHIIIKNINNKKCTPSYIKKELKLNNINLHSIVVDIINYVTLLTGQPLHVYDLDKINKSISLKKIDVQNNILLLNNNKMNFNTDVFAIFDNKNILSIPGIIGCDISKVNNNTTSILIESAYFNDKIISNTSEKYNLFTKSSDIFGKKIDITRQKISLNLVIKLITEMIDGIASNIITKQNKLFIKNQRKIRLYKKNIYEILGKKIDCKKIENIFLNLDFKYIKLNKFWLLYIPFYRNDIEIEENIINEIIRYYGYENIPCVYPDIKTIFNKNENKIDLNYIKNLLVNYGYNEVINYSFVNKNIENIISKNKHLIYLKNPLSENMNVMRNSLLQGLSKTLQLNMNRKHDFLKLFEAGNIYSNDNNNYKEYKVIGGICTENNSIEYSTFIKKNNFFTIKNIVENILNIIYEKKIQIYNKIKHNFLDNEDSTEIIIDKCKVGIIGSLNNDILNIFSFKKKIYFFEIYINNKLFLKKDRKKYKEFSKFPHIRRDLSIIINKNILFRNLIKYISELNIIILKKIELLDIYEKNIDNNNKSITLMFIFQSNNNTLTYKDVDDKIDMIIKGLNEKFNSSLRL